MTRRTRSDSIASASHPLRLKRGTKGRSINSANRSANSLAPRIGTTASGRGQARPLQARTAKSARRSGLARTRWKAGGAASNTEALKKGMRGSMRHWRHIPSDSSKQWGHFSAGSGGAQRSQHAGQKSFVSHLSSQEAQRGGKKNSIHVLKITSVEKSYHMTARCSIPIFVQPIPEEDRE